MSTHTTVSKINITAFRYSIIYKTMSWMPFYCIFLSFLNIELSLILSNIAYTLAVSLLFIVKSQPFYFQNMYLRSSVRINIPLLIYPLIHLIFLGISGTGFNFHTPIVLILWMVVLIDTDSRILLSHFALRFTESKPFKENNLGEEEDTLYEF